MSRKEKTGRLSWETKEKARMLATGLATVAVLVLGGIWPEYQVALWLALGAGVGTHLYFELKQPTNYKSIVISDEAVEYTGLGGTDVIRFDQIATVHFVREQAVFPDLYGPYIESKWFVQVKGNPHRRFIEIMDEWPHRRKLLRAFSRRLPGFDSAAARRGFRAWKEGDWLCYESRSDGSGGRPVVRSD